MKMDENVKKNISKKEQLKLLVVKENKKPQPNLKQQQNKNVSANSGKSDYTYKRHLKRTNTSSNLNNNYNKKKHLSTEQDISSHSDKINQNLDNSENNVIFIKSPPDIKTEKNKKLSKPLLQIELKENVKSSSNENLKEDEINENLAKNIVRKESGDDHKITMKPPTMNEINKLKETKENFHSNLFRTQLDHTLNQMNIPIKYLEYLTRFSKDLQMFLNQLKNIEITPVITSATGLKYRNIPVPLNEHVIKETANCNKKIYFLRPTMPFLAINDMAWDIWMDSRQVESNFCITIPPGYFSPGDHLNFRYHRKRALYLVHLLSEMIKYSKFDYLLPEYFFFSYYNNDSLKPIIEIRPQLNFGSDTYKKLLIRLLVVPQNHSFSLELFYPWKCNIQTATFDSVSKQSLSDFATHTYNNNILYDLTMISNQQSLLELFNTNTNIREATKLLTLWLKQRKLSEGFNGFNSYILASFVLYLYKHNIVNRTMSIYHVMRTVWYNLSISKWDEESGAISLSLFTGLNLQKPNFKQFRKAHEIVFVDVIGSYNICANVYPDIYRLVRIEASKAIDVLNNNRLDAFKILFKKYFPIYSQVDYILKIVKTDAIDQLLDLHIPLEDRINYAGSAHGQLLSAITRIFKKGMNKRIRLMLPIQQAAKEWSIWDGPSKCCEYVNLGLVVDTDFAFNIIDKEPQNTENKSNDFRKFWGDITKLRRFQNGQILESVVWGAYKDMLWEKRSIPIKIINQLMGHHFQLEADDFECIGTQFENVFKLNKAFRIEKLKPTISHKIDSEGLSARAIWEFDDLSRKLQNLENLKINIVGVTGISPVLRYCDPRPILPIAKRIDDKFRALHVINIMIQLEYNEKWPDDLVALRAVKTAIYYNICNEINRKLKLPTKLTYDGIYILKNGFCFYLEMSIIKEIRLLKKEVSPQGLVSYLDSTITLEMEKRQCILPNVCSGLKALHDSNPSFGPAVMIAKRWLYSHLIDDGLWPDECTELLMAYIYLQTSVYSVASSPQTAFIKFLRLLIETDWKNELFLISFNNNFDEEALKNFESKFYSERIKFPTVCIVTSYDLPSRYGHWWSTHAQPTAAIVHHIVSLAECTFYNIDFTITSEGEQFIKASKVFMASNKGYDLLIQIKPDQIPNTLCFEYGSPFVEYSKPNWQLPLAGLNYMKEAISRLRSGYSDFAAFFYNPCGGKEILIKCKPIAFELKAFDLNELIGTTVDANGKQIKVSKEVLIEDFKIVLKDFYSYIGPPS